MFKLRAIKSSISKEIDKLNIILNNEINQINDEFLSEIYGFLTQQKGKQIRGALTLLINSFYNPSFKSQDIINLAAGIELIHLASLVHDDIIDQSQIRRNQDTVFKKYGLDNAILSGVHIYSLALKRIIKIQNIQILENISDTVSKLCEGESFQMNHRFDLSISIEKYSSMIQKKTSALFSSLCYCTGILNGLDAKENYEWQQFGLHLGDLFQLSDDYLDVYDTQNTLSKENMQDSKSGDVSLPMLIASQQLSTNEFNSVINYLKTNKSEILNELDKYITIKLNLARECLTKINLRKKDQLKIESIIQVVLDRIK